MEDRDIIIFGNKISNSAKRKAIKKRNSYSRKYNFDENVSYPLSAENNAILNKFIGVKDVISTDKGEQISADKGIIVGNIRMGYGHYRMAMAIASAANSMGLIPYWFDLLSFPETIGSKIINELNSLYSLGSRLSQKYKLFNKLYWEPLTGEGFKKLDFNAGDLEMTRLMTGIYKNLPQDIPFIGTHAWPSQGAIHSGMTNVVNIIPDNWQLGLHLCEGAIHTVQSASAYLSYRMLRGMGKKGEILNPMPPDSIRLVGHYVDHEFVSNIETDCNHRINRLQKKQPRRFLLTIGGAGAQQKIFLSIVKKLLPLIKDGRVVLFVNLGDHKTVWSLFAKEIPELEEIAIKHFDNWNETVQFSTNALNNEVKGLHFFLNSDIFSAIYLTNLLMRCCDILITKPSELAFYPVPKLFIQRVGGHEAWGAIRGAEIGDSTIECDTIPLILQALDMLIENDDLLTIYCENIIKQNLIGTYNGAYNVIKLAMDRKRK